MPVGRMALFLFNICHGMHSAYNRPDIPLVRRLMMKTYLILRNFVEDKRGDLVDQSLIWVLIAIAAIAALTTLGGKIVDTLTAIAGSL